MSRDTYAHLKRYLTERGGGPVPRIVHDRLYLDVYEGVPRTRAQVGATAGAQEGEAPKQGQYFKYDIEMSVIILVSK